MTQTYQERMQGATARTQVRRRIELALMEHAEDADLTLTPREVRELAVIAVRSLGVPELRVIVQARVLTQQQHQVLLGIMRGETAEATGARLCISVHTVKTLRKQVYRRLGVDTGAAAVAVAMAAGLVTVVPVTVAESVGRLRSLLARPAGSGVGNV